MKNNWGDWEEEFDDKFVAVKEYRGKYQQVILSNQFANELKLPDKVKTFIHELLSNSRRHLISDLRERIKKIESSDYSVIGQVEDILSFLDELEKE